MLKSWNDESRMYLKKIGQKYLIENSLVTKFIMTMIFLKNFIVKRNQLCLPQLKGLKENLKNSNKEIVRMKTFFQKQYHKLDNLLNLSLTG